MKLNGIAKYLIRAGKRADLNTHTAFGSFLQFFQTKLRDDSPVDTGDFKDSWDTGTVHGNGDGFTATIKNEKSYASAIEFGSAPGSKPWPHPGLKTTMSGSRIYSSQAVGGVTKNAFSEKNVMAFAKEIAESILRAFK